MKATGAFFRSSRGGSLAGSSPASRSSSTRQTTLALCPAPHPPRPRLQPQPRRHLQAQSLHPLVCRPQRQGGCVWACRSSLQPRPPCWGHLRSGQGPLPWAWWRWLQQWSLWGRPRLPSCINLQLPCCHLHKTTLVQRATHRRTAYLQPPCFRLCKTTMAPWQLHQRTALLQRRRRRLRQYTGLEVWTPRESSSASKHRSRC